MMLEQSDTNTEENHGGLFIKGYTKSVLHVFVSLRDETIKLSEEDEGGNFMVLD